MKCNGSKIKMENYFILVILFATIGASDHAKIVDNSSSELSIVERLQRVRQLGHSLFYDWNLGGESEVEGNQKFKPFCSDFPLTYVPLTKIRIASHAFHFFDLAYSHHSIDS
jgi:hypothetical protein